MKLSLAISGEFVSGCHLTDTQVPRSAGAQENGTVFVENLCMSSHKDAEFIDVDG